MPMHDWTDREGWEGMHHLWMTEIYLHLRHNLPSPFRVFIGASPQVAIGGSPVKPDVGVTNGRSHGESSHATNALREPDYEGTVTAIEEDTSVQVERNGRLVAAIELISPRNKDRPKARDQYAARYLNYLLGGVHLLLVDVHRRPIGFGFPQMIAEAFGTQLPAPPAPSAIVYRVGATAATGGRMLSVWKETLTVGQPLPAMSLPLTLDLSISINLETTYNQAAENCYLD